MPVCSQNSDLFSIACIMFYLVAIASNKDPYLLSQYDRSSPVAHSGEVSLLRSRLGAKLAPFDSE